MTSLGFFLGIFMLILIGYVLGRVHQKLIDGR